MSIAPSTMTDADEQVKALRKIMSEKGVDGWDKAWENNVIPWDHGEVQPPLVQALADPSLNFAKQGKALVPGCGRGYDAVYLALKLGYKTIGMDLSPLALQAAHAYSPLHVYSGYLESAPDKNLDVTFMLDDFFTYTDSQEKFDVIYDHTFFCAIPLTLREGWGKQMGKLVAPGGYLICLVFPIDGDRPNGPPYTVSVDAIASTLDSSWEKVLDVVPDKSSDNHEGRQRLVVWKNKGTTST